MKQLSVDSGQLAVGGRQVVFEPQYDIEILYVDDCELGSDGFWTAEFFEGPNYRRDSLRKFTTFFQAERYGGKVLARYKRLIAAAELAFILGDDRSDIADQFDNVSKLDGDFVKVVRAADEGQEGEGAG